jgi:hypothetical protein
MKKGYYIGGFCIGNSRMDSFYVSYPFAKLQILNDQLIIQNRLRIVFRQIIIPKTEIVKLENMRGFVSRGIRVYHTSSSLPRYIVFWTFSQALLFDVLQKWLSTPASQAGQLEFG